MPERQPSSVAPHGVMPRRVVPAVGWRTGVAEPPGIQDGRPATRAGVSRTTSGRSPLSCSVGRWALVVALAMSLGVVPAAVAEPSFVPRALDVPDSPSSVAAADLDEDGAADLVVASRGNDSVSVLLGAAGGTFREPDAYPVGDQPSAVAVGDLNGDEALDLAVANEGESTVSVLLGAGDGSFQPASTLALGSGQGPVSIAIESLYEPGAGEDLIPDLALATPGSSDVTLVFRDETGGVRSTRSVAPPGAVPVGVQPVGRPPALLIASQGTNELEYVPPFGAGCPVDYPVVELDECFLPTGYDTRSFDENFAPLQPSGLEPIGPVPGSDPPVPQFVLLQGPARAVSLVNVTDAPDDRIRVTKTLTTPGSPAGVAAGEFDGRLERDLAVVHSDAPQLSLFLARLGGEFARVDLDAPEAGSDVAAADLDANGQADLAMTSAIGGRLWIFEDRWPSAVTGPAREIHPTSATLTGSATPDGLPGSAHFVVSGVDTVYGSSSARQGLPASTVAVPVAETVSGLEPGRTYRYQLAVSNQVGTSYGATQRFTTPAVPGAPPAPDTRPGPDPGSAAYGCADPRLVRAGGRPRAGGTAVLLGSDLGVWGRILFGRRVAEVRSWSPDRVVVTVPTRVRGVVPVIAECERRSNAVMVRVRRRSRAPGRMALGAPRVGRTTATIGVRVPAAGVVSLRSRYLTRASARLPRGTRVRLRLRLNGRGRAALARADDRRLKVRFTVTFAPLRGGRQSRSSAVTFTAGRAHR